MYESGVWSEWTTLVTFTGYFRRGWHHARVELSAYAGKQVRLGFWHTDYNDSNQAAGWYIDDVQLVQQAVPQLSGVVGFESGLGDWYSDDGVWQAGTPLPAGPPSVAGPGACFSGDSCVGTVLGGDYPRGVNSRLISPEVTLPTLAAGEELLLRYRQWWSNQVKDDGHVQVQVYESGVWSEWTTLVTFTGYFRRGWHHARVELSAYAGKQVRLGFWHTDYNDSNQAAGWYIDDVQLVQQAVPQLSGVVDFESGLGDWYSDDGVWQAGTPLPAGPPSVAGPGACFSGDSCVGTVLGGEYPRGVNSRLISPEVTLPTLAAGEELLLRYRQWWSNQVNDDGHVQVQVYESGVWSEWTTLVTFTGYFRRGWHHARVELSAYAGKQVRLGFWHTDYNDSNQAAGWYIDDVQLVQQAVPQLSGVVGFESGLGDWYSDDGVWQAGTPTSGPGACFSGDSCVGTVLGGEYPRGVNSRLISPEVTLPTLAAGEELLLRYRQWRSNQVNDDGYVQVQVYESGVWSEWTTLVAFTDYYLGWYYARVELSAYAGKQVRLGFWHTDYNDSNQAAGWYIDDIYLAVEFNPDSTNVAPTLDFALPLVLDEGATAAVTNQLLLLSDPDNDPITLTVVEEPGAGVLRLDGSLIGVGSSFTPGPDRHGAPQLRTDRQ